MVEVCTGVYTLIDNSIIISNLNDFIFCPASIYFHNLYGSRDTLTYQEAAQINGSKAHEAVDNGTYSSRKNILMAMDIYSEKYNIVGKIDIYDMEKKHLIERKRQIKTIYEGYIFQLYAQYFGMVEMGYEINQLFLYSMVDNKKYPVEIPRKGSEMLERFESVISEMKSFSLESFRQNNAEKCRNCIYEPACDRGVQ